MASKCLYQDENICILNPGDKRGVEVLHVIGYMTPIKGTKNNSGSVFDKIAKNGLKSSAQLLKETGVEEIPTTRDKAADAESFNVGLRKTYLEYDPQSMSRIFFRPPSTAPFKLEGDRFVSAGDWRDFQGSPREHRLFFGGESYADSMTYTAEPGNFAEGLVTLRVDPEQTYVFYEKMKNTYNRNRETGIPLPHTKGAVPANPRERYLVSRMKLSDYLDSLQANPGKVEYGFEILATTGNLNSSFFEKIIKAGDERHDTEELKEDKLLREKGAKNEENRLTQGMAMKMDIFSLMYPVITRVRKIRSAAGDLAKEVKSEIKTPKIKRAKIQKALDALDAMGSLSQESAMANLKTLITNYQNPKNQPKRKIHPLQKEWSAIFLKEEILEGLAYARKKREEAVTALKGLEGGAYRNTRRVVKSRSKQTRRFRK